MGRLMHFEIHAGDPARAIEFYSHLFGWAITQWQDHPYWIVSTGPTDQPGIDGAILQRTGEAPVPGAPVVGAVGTVEVDDVDASIQRALELGGRLALEKASIPGVGTVAYVLDTEANVVGLLQPERSSLL